MNKTIVRFEFKWWLLRPATILLLLLWMAMLFFAVHNGVQPVKERNARTTERLLEQQERLQKHVLLMDSFATGKLTGGVYWNDARNAYDIGLIYGKRSLVKKEASLAPLSIGQSHLQHSLHTINSAPENWFMALKKAEKLSNPHNSFFGNMDAAFTITVLLPLLIIVFSFNILSAEKEDGSLPLLMVQGLSVKQLLSSKILFRYLITTGLSWLTIIAAMGVNGFSFFADISTGLAFTAVLFLYSAVWHALVMLVNLWRKSSDFNAGLLFTTWIAWVLVVPAISIAIVAAVQPVPEKITLVDEVRETLTDFDRKNAQILDQFYTDHPQLAIKDSSKVMPLFMYKYMIKYMNTLHSLTPVITEYKSKALAQSKIAGWVSILSPAMLMQDAADEMSGHSQTQFLQFQQYADSVTLQWNNYFYPITLANQYLTTNEFKQLPMPVYTANIKITKLAMLISALLIWWLIILLAIKRALKKSELNS